MSNQLDRAGFCYLYRNRKLYGKFFLTPIRYLAYDATIMKTVTATTILSGVRERPCDSCYGEGHTWDDFELGSRLREYREKRDISARHIAKHLEFSPSYLSDLENGRRRWTRDLVERYIKAVSQA